MINEILELVRIREDLTKRLSHSLRNKSRDEIVDLISSWIPIKHLQDMVNINESKEKENDY